MLSLNLKTPSIHLRSDFGVEERGASFGYSIISRACHVLCKVGRIERKKERKKERKTLYDHSIAN